MYKVDVQHQTIVSVPETSSKMASMLCQKWLTIFCQKVQNFVSLTFGPYSLVQISPAFGPNKIPDQKINFCSKFAAKLFCVTIINADIESLKSLHTFLKNICSTY